MTIKIGDRLPDAVFAVMGEKGPEPRTTKDIFAGKKVALFAVPGAFTPTCHRNHLPGFLENLDVIMDKGVDTVACVAVNDVFVMDAWGKATGADGKIVMLADGSAMFAKATGLELDGTDRGLGVRSKRFSMIVDDGVVTALNVEEAPGTADVSGAANLIRQL